MSKQPPTAKDHVRRFRDGLAKDESMADLEKRMMEQMRKAFFDSIQEVMESDDKEKAHDWLISLHNEMHDRFVSLMPSRKDQLDDFRDNELFARMLRGGAFRTKEVVNLINYTFEQLKLIVAPDMDSDTDLRLQDSLSKVKTGASFGSIVAPFLQHVHTLLDETTRRVLEIRQQQLKATQDSAD